MRKAQPAKVIFLRPSAISWYSILCKDGLERPADSVILRGLLSTAVQHILIKVNKNGGSQSGLR